MTQYLGTWQMLIILLVSSSTISVSYGAYLPGFERPFGIEGCRQQFQNLAECSATHYYNLHCECISCDPVLRACEPSAAAAAFEPEERQENCQKFVEFGYCGMKANRLTSTTSIITSTTLTSKASSPTAASSESPPGSVFLSKSNGTAGYSAPSGLSTAHVTAAVVCSFIFIIFVAALLIYLIPRSKCILSKKIWRSWLSSCLNCQLRRQETPPTEAMPLNQFIETPDACGNNNNRNVTNGDNAADNQTSNNSSNKILQTSIPNNPETEDEVELSRSLSHPVEGSSANSQVPPGIPSTQKA